MAHFKPHRRSRSRPRSESRHREGQALRADHCACPGPSPAFSATPSCHPFSTQSGAYPGPSLAFPAAFSSHTSNTQSGIPSLFAHISPAASSSHGGKVPQVPDSHHKHGKRKDDFPSKRRAEQHTSHISVPIFPSEKSTLKTNFSSATSHSSGLKAPHTADLPNRYGKRKDDFRSERKKEQGSFLHHPNPHIPFKPGQAEVISPGFLREDERGSSLVSHRRGSMNGMSVRYENRELDCGLLPHPNTAEKISQRRGSGLLQHPNTAEKISQRRGNGLDCGSFPRPHTADNISLHRGNTYGKFKKEGEVSTPDQFGENPPQRRTAARGQGIQDHRKGKALLQEMSGHGEEDDLIQKHKSGNAAQKERKNEQRQETTQKVKARRRKRNRAQGHEVASDVNENVQRNDPQQAILQNTDNNGTGPQHGQSQTPQPDESQHSKSMTTAIETTLHLRIHDIITDTAVLDSMVRARVNAVDPELMSTCIQHDDQFTYCCLTCKSKNVAKRLQGLILKNRKHLCPEIECSFNAYKKEEEDQAVENSQDHEQQKNQTTAGENHLSPQTDCSYNNSQKEGDQAVDKRQKHKRQKDHTATKEKILIPQTDCSSYDYQPLNTQDDHSSHDYQKEEDQALDKILELKRQKNQAAAKEMLKKQVQCEINTMSEKALSKHQETMDGIEKKLDTSKSKLGDLHSLRETRAEIAALESKLGELQKQKAEFSTAIEGFRAQLITLLDSDTYQENVKFLRKQVGVECSRLERALPMYARRQDVLHMIQENGVSILLAETGSGKSTQIVQYLLEAGFVEGGKIVCTQPRKVAVISLSTRVAEELATNVGNRVGYKAGLKDRTSPSTKILYMTDHALLNECLTDPDLKAFSCVVVDEAHERSLYTDLLLTMIKRCLKKRPDLKVIITSATIDPQVFVNFFGSCPVLRVSGRAFPVDVEWEDSASEENDFEKYVDAAVNKVIEIHRTQPPGDVLVFLTSAAEIQKCCDMTQQRLKDRTDFKCLPLHGQLQSDEQQKVFKPLEKNVRKIVYATNCAETSITIDGIKYVVDTGVAKEMVYDAKKKVSSLVVTTISQSSSEQRKGRAGRTSSGKCYRLYSRQSYQKMDKISLPEILKIHLGHALLKLAELGFTPDMYDFVQSPGQEAIEAALKTLHQLGGLDDNNVITDTGRWIARLPFDPKLGLMTLYGHNCGLLYDAIVLASLMSTGSSLFFRGTSEKDREKLDRIRLKFSHEGGDGMTALEVYKAWQTVDERQKNQWCMANSVNGKAVRGIKDSVKDIIQILRKEVKIEVVQQFSDAQDTADKLRKIIFQCNVSSLCHYLGKEKAGYFAAHASRRVHFHPSSAMCALADFPKWVVYDQLLKTSRDFITGITPVDDAWLQEMTTEQCGFDLEQVRRKKLDVVFSQPAGSHAFFAMVGPRYTMLRHYEEQCSLENSDDVVIIEGKRETGELKVFSTGMTQTAELLRNKLIKVVGEAVKEVQQEVRELTIGSEESGLRVILGQGGQLTDILMPQETRKVFVTNPSEDLTPEQVREKFQQFGDICFIHQFPSGRNWGFLVYRTAAEAATAAESTRDNDSNVGELERRRRVKHQAEFRAKLSWCRRAGNGTAFVDISPAYMSLFLQLRDVYVDNNPIVIKTNKKSEDDSLYLRGLPLEVSEEGVKHSLLHALGYTSDTKGIIEKVVVVRKKVDLSNKKELKELQEGLKAKFQRQLNTSSVEITVWPPREQSVRFAGEARFTDPIEGFDACQKLKGRLFLGHAMVDIEPIVSATLHVQHLIYEACREKLDTLKTEVLPEVEMEMKKKQGSENWLLCLKADDMQSLVRVRTFINEIIRGDILDYNAAPDVKHLLTPAGRTMIKRAEKLTSAYVCFDNRNQTLAIHGSTKACTMMKMELNKYLGEVVTGTVEELVLQGGSRPPGLLKALVRKYGEDLDNLREEAGLLDIIINYRWHKVKVTGPPESIAKAKTLVEEVSSALAKACQLHMHEDESIDCVACLCPIDTDDLYRLEACAHPYCKDCIKRQVQVAITDRHLPVVCCQEGCNVPLAWRDFNSLARLRHLKLPDLASSALSAYVLTNRDKACFCTTPNCPMVYRLTSEEDAKTFQCPECSVRVCTGCRAQAHEGVSCSMLRSSDQAKVGVEDWVSQDRKKRRACPGCNSPIEKIGGCNRMTCGACRAIFCWLCGKKYHTSEDCYKHLNEAHGGVFDINDLLY